jgi:transposase
MEERILRMKSLPDERQWRLYLANEAMAAGYGGVSKVNRITGVSRTTITKGIEELKKEITIDGKARRSGGGPKRVEEKHPDIEERIRKIVDGST